MAVSPNFTEGVLRDYVAGYTQSGSNSGASLIAQGRDGVDPEQTLANITQAQWNDYVRDIQPIEDDLINKATSSTELIDQAKADRDAAMPLMQGIANRQAQRYGAALTPAQLKEQQRSLARGTTLGGIQAVNDARIAQKDANRALLADLIDIGQGVNRSSLGELSNAAGNQSARDQAYKNARAQHKANMYSTVGTLGAAAAILLI